MWPSLQMRTRRPKGPPAMPEGINGKDAAVWAFLMHLNGRIDGLHTLMLSSIVAAFLAALAIFVTVLVK